MTNPAPRTNEGRAALDAQVLELVAAHDIRQFDGDGFMGPKALAFALDVSLATLRASLRRLYRADRLVLRFVGNERGRYVPAGAQS